MFLANNEYTFYCKVVGETTGEPFEGDFTVKCILNNEEQIDIAMRTDRYNGGSKTLAPQFALFNRTLAEIEVRIIKKGNKTLAPTWWNESDGGRLLYDTNIVYHVFTEALKAQQVWNDRLKAKADQMEKDSLVTPKRDKIAEEKTNEEG